MATEQSPVASDREPIVSVRSVRVTFGGLVALGGIDLDVAQGERLAILGPNGAGKTTLFNVIAGDIAPAAGTVTIRGEDCTFQSSRHRPSLGVARTYQKTRLFPGLSVADNLYLAVSGHRGRHLALWRNSDDARARARAEQAAEAVWLDPQLDAMVADLSHGQKRQLEVGMAVATDPDVLLLDEPASGLSRGERERLIELLSAIDSEVTLLVIEHDMDVAFRVADRVVVMADGVMVTGGTPEQVQADPVVHEIYLGNTGAA
jgi:branched-chain amino acid transport system ATP-binding protein